MYIIKKCKRSDLGAESPHIKICRVPPAIISSTFSFLNCPYGESTPFPLPPPPKRNIRHVKGRTIRKVMGGGGGGKINFRTHVPRVFLFPNMAGEDLGTWLPFSNGTFSNDVTSAILVLQNKLWSHYRLLPG